MKEKKEVDHTPTKIEVELPKWTVDYLNKRIEEEKFEDINDISLYIIRRDMK